MSSKRAETGKRALANGETTPGTDMTALPEPSRRPKRTNQQPRPPIPESIQVIWTTNPQGKVTDDIPGWRALTGQTLAQIQGDGWLGALHPDDRAVTIESWTRAVAARSPFAVVYRVQATDGEYRRIAARGEPVLMADGELRAWIGTCSDVTEEKRAKLDRGSRTKSNVGRSWANTADNRLGDRLLVISDDDCLGHLVKSVAESAGFQVLVTFDPADCEEQSRNWRPTVIMLDLGMAGTDGIQLLRGLAADKYAGHVILMSGADTKVLESAVQLGRARGLKISAVLEKPVRLDALRTSLALVQVTKELLAADLSGAIATDQLFLEYQLKFDCRTARMTGVEALVRWRHPTLGIIQPDQFIPLAEETDLIHKLTDWVVGAAAKQMAVWHVNNPALEVAVNISAKDVQDPGLPDRLHAHCRNAGIKCPSMTLELTETGAMREALPMMDVLTRLRLKGFKLSIDDFGTGFSSLVQLQKMPFSEVKIDRSFVMQMTSNEGCRAIVEIVIDLARKLGLRSVAEGVEDDAALHSLMALNCDAAQGYHLSRPVPAERIPAFISDYQLIRNLPKAPKAPFSSPFTNTRAWRRRKTTTRHGSACPTLAVGGEVVWPTASLGSS